MAEQNVLEKSMRSVFVGNIPYEVTEEKLRDIFNEVGPVISFKLVYDRETGKSKGYGFCEYKDQETALSAMRNLNGYEIGGRTLRVDNACTEKSRLELQSLLMGTPISESQYGDAVSPEKAPEVISNVISSLPPEQLYELMKQMKYCVQNNPVEARNMLLKNPQLSYALLQAQVCMKIVEPETAQKMLHPAHTVPVHRPTNSSTSKLQPLLPSSSNQWQKPCTQVVQTNFSSDWHHINGLSNQQPIHSQALTQHNQLIESRPSFSGSLQTPGLNVENQSFMDRRSNSSFVPILPPMSVPPPSIKHPVMFQEPPPKIQPLPQSQQTLPSQMDSEKETLILQVMQLTEEQIAMLPEDQRQSLLQLKEKIINSSSYKENH